MIVLLHIMEVNAKSKYRILNTLFVFYQHSSAILADLDVKFYPYVKDPIQRLRSSIFHGQLNGMELDDKFLKVFNKTGKFLFPSELKNGSYAMASVVLSSVFILI